MIRAPQSFVIREECEKAAFQKGFRRRLGEQEGWAGFASTTAHGNIHLAAAGIDGPWFLALDHAGVIAELGLPITAMAAPGKASFVLATLGELYTALDRVYALGISLPDAPLREFELRTANLPKTTEAERLVVQRIGQDIFRARIMDYWQGRCPLTGITDVQLLRASHIVPWAKCESDQERLNVHNGLLLSSLWDAAFDSGLVTFDGEGQPIASPILGERALIALGIGDVPWLRLTPEHKDRLEWHRENVWRTANR